MPLSPNELPSPDRVDDGLADAVCARIDQALKDFADELYHPGHINVPISRDDIPAMQTVIARYNEAGWIALLRNRKGADGALVYWLFLKPRGRKANQNRTTN